MPVYVTCARCGIRIYLGVRRRFHLPPVFRLRCPSCGYEGVYTPSYAVEEGVYTLTCPVCKMRFYVVRRPPLTVECPHCNSVLRIISIHGEPVVVKASSTGSTQAAVILALLGALLGALASEDKLKGALAGGFIGFMLGVFVDALSEPEARYIEE